MLLRFATVVTAYILISVATAPLALTAPESDPDPAVATASNAVPPAPPANDGLVPSGARATRTTADGWTITVWAEDESEVAVAPLTTSTASREYIVGGAFNASVTGAGTTTLTGGTLEVGYQIGCGLELGANGVQLTGSVGVIPSLGPTGLSAALPINGSVAVYLVPGKVNIVPVSKMVFKGTDPRITISDFRVKIDGCVGESFLRSYATLTGTTTDTQDIISYTGITKAV